MPPAGFEPTVTTGEWPQTYALVRAAAGAGLPIRPSEKFSRNESAVYHKKCLIQPQNILINNHL